MICESLRWELASSSGLTAPSLRRLRRHVWAPPSNTDTFDRYDPTIEGVTCNNEERFQRNSREAVKLVRQPGASKAGIARYLVVGANLLGQWCREQEGRSVPARSGNNEAASTSEFASMRRKLAKVKTEHDILKKALGHFAADHK